MTATEVDGKQVIDDRPTLSPHLTDRAGQPLVWQRTRRLTLDDGSIVYGCGDPDCVYTSPNVHSIRPHLQKHVHRPRRRPAMATASNGASAKTAKLAEGMSLADLLARLSELDEVRADRDAWKQRAKAAERSLASLRKALTP